MLWYESRCPDYVCILAFAIQSTVSHLIPDIIVADLGIGIGAFGVDVQYLWRSFEKPFSSTVRFNILLQ